MITDPVGDTLIRIKNGYRASKTEIRIPYSRMNESLLKVLKNYKFIEDYKRYRDQDTFLTVYLYASDSGEFSDLKQISKPGRRVYVNSKRIPYVRDGYGISILSTPQGVMSGEEARKKNLGGELLVKVW
jgi:small subunit ribosomal protein S8